MSEILSANDGLINPAYDKFLDGHPTRRELQKAFNKMGKNDAELFSMVDTNCLVVNFLCEKAGVTRAELDAYVARKAEEVKKFHETQKTQEGDNDLGGEAGVQSSVPSEEPRQVASEQ